MSASTLRFGIACSLLASLVACLASPASAATSATLSYTSALDDHGTYTYNLTLTNTGTTPLKTLWFSWIPYASFLPSVPGNIASAPTWTGQVVNDYYGNSILWDTTDAAGLAPGSQASGFSFTSNDSPATLAGLDSYYGYYPVGTSYVYSGSVTTPNDPLPAGFASIIATAAPTPEPATAIAIFAGAACVARRRRA